MEYKILLEVDNNLYKRNNIKKSLSRIIDNVSPVEDTSTRPPSIAFG
jgi:hypothetical protein